MWFKIVGPDGQTYVVQAADADKATQIARSHFANQFGATDMQGWAQIAQPAGADAAQYAAQMPHLAIQSSPSSVDTDVSKGKGSAALAPTTPIDSPVKTNTGTAPQTGLRDEYGAQGHDYTLESQDPMGAFARALATRGISQFGSLGNYYSQQYDPFKTAFEARVRAGDFGNPNAEGFAPGENAFENYAASQTSPWQDISRTYKQFAGMQPGVGTPNMSAGTYIAPQTNEEYGDANDLFRNALQGRVGSYAAKLLGGNNINALQTEYGAQSNPMRAGSNYLAYLQRRLGLGNIQF